MPQDKGYTYEELLKMGAVPAPDNAAAIEAIKAAQAAKYPSSQEQGRGGAGRDAQPGILQQALKHAQDFTTGIDKAGGSFIQSGGDWVANSLGMKVPPPRMTPTGRDVFAPDNTAQAVGNVVGKVGLGVAGGMAGGPTLAGGVAAGGLTGALQNPDAPEGPAALGMVAPVVSSAIGALPSAKRAGAVFDQIKKAGQTRPVNTTPEAISALQRAEELSRVAGGRPTVLTRATQRILGPQGKGNPPLTYPESFDFASAAKRLSRSEVQSMAPGMQAQLDKFAGALQAGNRQFAESIGMGKQFDAAMREYRQAMQIVKAKDLIKDAAKNRFVQSAVGTGAALAIAKKYFGF